MYKSGTILKSPADFDNALFFGVFVEIWQDGKLIDHGGYITKNTDDEVYIGIDDDHYSKDTYEFRVK